MRVGLQWSVVAGPVLVAAAAVAAPPLGDDPVAVVHRLRTESNAAIAAHDSARLERLLAEDYLGISGATGQLDRGSAATARSYGDIEFRDPTFIKYRRVPAKIVAASSGHRIAESGRWEGVWKKEDGIMRTTGIYLAMWIPVGSTWRVKSETFVALGCSGSRHCADID